MSPPFSITPEPTPTSSSAQVHQNHHHHHRNQQTQNQQMNTKNVHNIPPKEFRKLVRTNRYTQPTNGVCPDYLQCNLVILPKEDAFDFLLFCQRNEKACPLIEVCDVGSSLPTYCCRDNDRNSGVVDADNGSDGDCFDKEVTADLKTDVPKYRIYRHGKLEKEVTDCTNYYPEDGVAFLIGCSFSCDSALLQSGISLRSIEQNTNVPMYNTNIQCRSAGKFSGSMVVSMKPIQSMDVAKEVRITSQYPKAHGGPVCVGCPESIGIMDLEQPDYGEKVEVKDGEVPVFHACGVTALNVLGQSGVEFAITHSPGFMFVTDLRSDAEI